MAGQSFAGGSGLQWYLRSEGSDQHTSDTATAHLQDLDHMAIEPDGVADASDAAELSIHVAADCVRILDFDLGEPESLDYFCERHLPINDRSFGGMLQLRWFSIELVL